MIQIPTDSLENAYNTLKSYYIANNGSNKFEKIYSEIANSNKFKELCQFSIQNSSGLSGTEFFGLVFSLRYFIIAKTETRVLGALIALKLWNETVNKIYQFADEKAVNFKVKAIFGKFNLL